MEPFRSICAPDFNVERPKSASLTCKSSETRILRRNDACQSREEIVTLHEESVDPLWTLFAKEKNRMNDSLASFLPIFLRDFEDSVP
jgi:hypothetical protein